MLFTKGKKIKKVKQEKNIKNNKKIAKKKETLFTKFQKKFNSLKVAILQSPYIILLLTISFC